MNRLFNRWFPLFCLLLFSCTSSESSLRGSAILTDEQIQTQINAFLEDWLEMIQDREYRDYKRLMGDDVRLTLVRGDGEKVSTRSVADIIAYHKEFFINLGQGGPPPSHSREIYPQAERGRPEAKVVLDQPPITAFFEFSPEGRKLQVRGMSLFQRYEEELQVDLFQKWADGNDNWILEAGEQKILYETVRDFHKNTGPVRHELDAYFDRNQDDFIDEIELEYAREILWRDIPHRINQYQPKFYHSYLDEFQNHQLMTIHMANGLYYMLFENPEFLTPRSPRRDSGIFEYQIDFNGDGYLDIAELEHYRDLVGRKISQLPPPPLDIKAPVVLHKDLQLWADFDNDGEYEENEISDFSWIFYELVLEFHDLAVTPVDFYFNLNHNYFLEVHEKRYAFTYLLSKYLPLYIVENPDFFETYLDLNENGTIDRDEIDEIGEWLTVTINIRRPVRMRLDKKIDKNRNSWVDQDEFDFFRETLLNKLCEYWLLDDDASADRWQVLTELDKLTDLDANGSINAEEREQAGLGLKNTHQVSSEFGDRIDFDRDGFIDEYEIQEAFLLGIRQIEEIRMTGAAGKTGKKLAVVKVSTEESEITESVADIILSYIENAFVNTGLYQVLERRNLDTVLEEQELMLSGLIKEEDVVEIGNLAGAEMVSIAELSSVENVYYINLKLVATETGKIVASSMAQTNDFRNIFRTCARAVDQLH